MKYIFIGDVHGKVDAVKKALEKDGMKIFVGDFIDSYDRSVSEHSECYHLVLEAIKAGKARAIFGNHELSYLMPNVHRCSGWDRWRDALMRQFEVELWKHFEPYILLEENLLISHAGITYRLWDEQGLSVENLEAKLKEWWPDQKSPMHWIGNTRGGIKPYGGMFWCDFRYEFEPIKELSQIFGHTRVNTIHQQENSFAIDCLDSETKFLELEIEEKQNESSSSGHRNDDLC